MAPGAGGGSDLPDNRTSQRQAADAAASRVVMAPSGGLATPAKPECSAPESENMSGWRVNGAGGQLPALPEGSAGGAVEVQVSPGEGGEETGSEEDCLTKWTKMNRVAVELARARQQVERQDQERARLRLLDALSQAQRHVLAHESQGTTTV